jgi:hypothetical protein
MEQGLQALAGLWIVKHQIAQAIPIQDARRLKHCIAKGLRNGGQGGTASCCARAGNGIGVDNAGPHATQALANCTFPAADAASNAQT